MRRVLRRFLILTFAFLVAGAFGSGFFFLWAAGKTVSHRTHDRWARRWVENLSREQLRHYLYIAFLVSGTLGAASTMRLIVKSDLNDTSLDD